MNSTTVFAEPVQMNVTSSGDLSKSNYDNMGNQLNKTNSILENINKSINQNNVILQGQGSISSNFSKSMQDIEQTLKQTNSMLKEQNAESQKIQEYTQTLENMRWQASLIGGFEAALVGALVALVGERFVANRIQQRQINKTHELINDDIRRIYTIVNGILLETHILRAQLSNSQNIQQQILQRGGIVDQTISRFLVNTKLLHWDAIVSSGYLIKLATAEIRNLQSLHDFLEDIRRNSLDAYNGYVHNIVFFCTNLSPASALPEITTQLENMMAYFHQTYPLIIQRIQRIPPEINWIKLDSTTE